MPRAIIWIKVNEKVVGTIYIAGAVEDAEMSDIEADFSKPVTISIDAKNFPDIKEERAE